MEKKKILLVDDSDLVIGILTKFLEKHEYEVFHATNGITAVEQAYKIIPDLIIMDVEMPLLQGYQASRLLKSRRGVRDIPIIMHTGLSEDKDQYWALASGADAFVSKDFENITIILEKIEELIGHEPYNTSLIADEARLLTRDKILEILGLLFDKELFQTTILNLLAEIGQSIGSLTVTLFKILKLLNKVCEHHIAVILIENNSRAGAYIYPSAQVYEKDVDEFISVCLNNFYACFPTINLDKPERTYMEINQRDDFRKIRIDNRRLSSYSCFELLGKGGTVVGTLHIGNFTNNYFSDYILDNIRIFARGAGIILENSILFNRVNIIHEKIRNVFSKFVPMELIDDFIEKESNPIKFIGEKRRVTVMFADIRQFTTISENNSAEVTVAFLNDFFNLMEDCIKKYGGMINKFIGDAVLALFGAPKSYTDNACRAARTAVEMINRLGEVQIANIKLPPGGLRIGIGIHDGDAVVGNIGSHNQYDYTVIGDTVNVASRLESLTKYYKLPILISDTVKTGLREDFKVREIDTVKVKGKSQATSLYTIEIKNPLPASAREDWLKGIKLYKAGNWHTALEYFQKILMQCPKDQPARLYTERCHRFIQTPPINWDGAIVLNIK